MHATLRRQLLHLATDLAELVENPSDLPHGFDLLTRSSTLAPLVAERSAPQRPRSEAIGEAGARHLCHIAIADAEAILQAHVKAVVAEYLQTRLQAAHLRLRPGRPLPPLPPPSPKLTPLASRRTS